MLPIIRSRGIKRCSIIKITLTWKVLPTFLQNFPPANIYNIYGNNKLEWGCPNGTKYPPRQPIPNRATLPNRARVYRQTDRRTGWFQYTPPNFVAGGIMILIHVPSVQSSYKLCSVLPSSAMASLNWTVQPSVYLDPCVPPVPHLASRAKHRTASCNAKLKTYFHVTGW